MSALEWSATGEERSVCPSPACCRGLLQLIGSERGRLAEGRFLRACGTSARRRALREEIAALVDQGVIERHTRGRGASLRVIADRADRLLETAIRGLSPRARISGGVVQALFARLQNGGLRTLPQPQAPAPATGPPPLDEQRVLTVLEQLWAVSRYAQLVSIPQLVRALGLTDIEALEPLLRRLARARKLRLEPLSDPLGVSDSERALGIPDPVKGLLYYVSPARPLGMAAHP